MRKQKNTICPVEQAGGLDNSTRRIIQNPQKILKPYVKKGMSVLDLGCGPGFFAVELAKIVGKSGKVFAIDLQLGMLEKVRQKIAGTPLEPQIVTHQCSKESIDLKVNVDFILAFYVIHEITDQVRLLQELKSILKPTGLLLIVEPKFHVSKKSFQSMIDKIENIGLKVTDQPKVFFSRAILVKNTS